MDIEILAVTKEGFLVNSCDWTRDWSKAKALQCGVHLENEHWQLIEFMRNYYLRYQHLPNMRMLVKAIASQFGADKGNSPYLHRLFGESPLKQLCLLAGVPKPPNCL